VVTWETEGALTVDPILTGVFCWPCAMFEPEMVLVANRSSTGNPKVGLAI
jgi:hypothetical protein